MLIFSSLFTFGFNMTQQIKENKPKPLFAKYGLVYWSNGIEEKLVLKHMFLILNISCYKIIFRTIIVTRFVKVAILNFFLPAHLP